MIPVLGMPVLNKPELVQRMFNSIDYGSIDRLFIVDNGADLSAETFRWPTHVNNIHIANPGYNMGVGASWNHIIKANISAPWWLICNNDIILEAGSLKKLVEVMDANQDKPMIGKIVMGNEASWGNHFGAFGINDKMIDKVGWFDENLHPIYFEDTDYMRRVEYLTKPSDSVILVPSKTHHDGNRSWKGDAGLSNHNKRSWDGNVAYFDDKWKDDYYVRYWRQPTVERLRYQSWDIPRRDNVK